MLSNGFNTVRAGAGDDSITASGGTNHGTFNTVNNTISIATNNSGTLVINLDTGDYSYTSQKTTTTVITENIGFTLSDNDGDLSSANLVINVNTNAVPVAGADHIITNIFAPSISVPVPCGSTTARSSATGSISAFRVLRSANSTAAASCCPRPRPSWPP